MRVGNLYENKEKTRLSFEFFPPRDEKAEAGFYKVVDDLTKLSPDYMSVTFGAGGSTKEGSYQAVKKMITEKNLPTVAYIAGFGLGPDEITTVLDKYKELGVETIFVIRGDEPRTDDFTPHPDSFSYASDMLSFIRERYDFDLGCAGYPEGHIQAESLDKDIEYLKLKVANGAKYVVAQYCYDNTLFFKYVEKCRAAGIAVPIIPGIMPVYSIKLTNMLCKLCGAMIPEEMAAKLDSLAEADKSEVAAFGVDFAIKQCSELLKHGVDGLHFYTMDRSKSVTEIVNRLREDNLL
ncbi:methylenetetrahydrofolate reductase [NAD(P)H] [Desulfonema magnum]|uniref:Methylenetetrahydrofolate reductase n=1 Tax=Desulfonema magnum TaxID=45655 RepID=A0A975GSR5_9BACT|nr:methylenetetrahydrofolate reductase [NAD(P)H] [Desulfonema magnum]QTA92324.1 5,10-methylenetetrahydrofolate reductase [Desulfonema magnum]